jgi:hypothetical protein
MWYQDPAEVASFATAGYSLVRLPDSIYTKPDGSRYIPSSRQYADDLVKQIIRWNRAGFRHFVPDCEPNWSWPQHRQGPWEWAYFMNEALFHPEWGVQRRVAGNIQLGLTAFANHDWTTWLNARTHIVPKFAFVSAHCYWQAPQDMYSEIFGLQASFLWKRFGKPVFITEAGNSLCQLPSPPAPEVIEAKMAEQYPQYLFWLSKPEYAYIQAVYFYILGGTDDWKGFRLTHKVCDAINRWQARQ